MSEITTAEDRCQGVLVGLAAGDRIGGPIRMAVRLAESLVDCGSFNPSDILNRYLSWWREGAFDTGPVSERAFALLGLRRLPRSQMQFRQELRCNTHSLKTLNSSCRFARWQWVE